MNRSEILIKVEKWTQNGAGSIKYGAIFAVLMCLVVGLSACGGSEIDSKMLINGKGMGLTKAYTQAKKAKELSALIHVADRYADAGSWQHAKGILEEVMEIADPPSGSLVLDAVEVMLKHGQINDSVEFTRLYCPEGEYGQIIGNRILIAMVKENPESFDKVLAELGKTEAKTRIMRLNDLRDVLRSQGQNQPQMTKLAASMEATITEIKNNSSSDKDEFLTDFSLQFIPSQLADTYFALGKVNKAKAILKKEVEGNKGDWHNLRIKAAAEVAADNGQWDLAYSILEKTTGNKRHDEIIKTKAYIALQAAEQALTAGNMEDAANAWAIAIDNLERINVRSGRAYWHRAADIAIQIGKPDSAVKILQILKDNDEFEVSKARVTGQLLAKANKLQELRSVIRLLGNTRRELRCNLICTLAQAQAKSDKEAAQNTLIEALNTMVGHKGWRINQFADIGVACVKADIPENEEMKRLLKGFGNGDQLSDDNV